MRPLILITNDDGIHARGIQHLMDVAQAFGDIVVMAPEHNASGMSSSLTTQQPLRVHVVEESPERSVYTCSGTPVDCVKMASEHFTPRRPSLVLSGINHGSNASINVVYSATMGAVLEACLDGYQAIGFSLLHHSPEADFSGCTAIVRTLVAHLLEHPLPEWTALNVNIPRGEVKGIRQCRAARARWTDSLTPRTDPLGRPYWWMTGKFVNDDPAPDTDLYALDHGYASVVPIRPDFTADNLIGKLNIEKGNEETT